MSNALAPFLDLLAALIDGLRRPGSKAPLQSLDDALRIAVREHQALRGALAHATVAERREAERLETLMAEIAALEGRAILAIQGGRQDLAERAAESLVVLEAQRMAQSAICAEARSTMGILRQRLDADRIRLQKLDHGRALAKIRAIAPAHALTSPIAEAEDQLATINATDAVTRTETQPQHIAQELADAGFGPSHQSEVAAILERLQATAQTSGQTRPAAISSAMIGQPSQL